MNANANASTIRGVKVGGCCLVVLLLMMITMVMMMVYILGGVVVCACSGSLGLATDCSRE